MSPPLVLIVRAGGLDLGEENAGPGDGYGHPHCEVAVCAGPSDVTRALAQQASGFVLLLNDREDREGAIMIASSVRACTVPVIGVALNRWDGERHSPVEAACKGVISGFGVAGVRAALRLLASGR